MLITLRPGRVFPLLAVSGLRRKGDTPAYPPEKTIQSPVVRIHVLPAAGIILLLSGCLQEQYFDPAAGARVRASTPAADAVYLVDTGARLVLPGRDLHLLDDMQEKVYLQFSQTLDAGGRADLQATGIVFYETLAPYTYLASVPASAGQLLAEHPLFRGLAPVVAADKVTAGLFSGQVADHARRPGNEAAVVFRFYRNVSLDEALAVLDAQGIKVVERGSFLFGHRLEATSTTANIMRAAASPKVQAISEVPPQPTTLGATSTGGRQTQEHDAQSALPECAAKQETTTSVQRLPATLRLRRVLVSIV